MRTLFLNTDLYDQALVHSSYANENRIPDNERLEFLGDAVLQLCATRLLYSRFSDADEGTLSQIRNRLVNTDTLADLARQLGLPEHIRLGRGMDSARSRDRSRLLACTFEAVLGAWFLDQGLEKAQSWLNPLLEPIIDGLEEVRCAREILQEWSQANRMGVPRFEVVDRQGPDHQLIFQVQVYLEDTLYGEGTGPSKRAASDDAAKQALGNLEKP